MTQKDNSTFSEKARLRRRVLDACTAPPFVLETHGGYGRLFERVWHKARGGVVIDNNETKAEHLARQRPTWSVYHCDCVKTLREGLAHERAFDVIDLDPYGGPWEVLEALARPGRKFPDRWHLVVNDGLRESAKYAHLWRIKMLAPKVQKYGTHLFGVYLDLARELVEEFAASIGFRVESWVGYYTGHDDLLTHYWVKLARINGADLPAVALP